MTDTTTRPFRCPICRSRVYQTFHWQKSTNGQVLHECSGCSVLFKDLRSLYPLRAIRGQHLPHPTSSVFDRAECCAPCTPSRAALSPDLHGRVDGRRQSSETNKLGPEL